jgi:DNA invertase Pin-like site-specific DNA recombinase
MTIRAYVRVSTTEQATNGHGLDAQRASISVEADRRAWVDLAWYEDGGMSGKDMDRPAMRALLSDVRRGDVLVVARLDRLSRSLTDFASLMERAQRQRWNVVALDLGIDLATPNGEFMASVLAAMARWERRIIGERTREGLAAAKAKGRLPGRRSTLPRDVQARLLTDRVAGLSLRAIADWLNAEQVRTATGRRWTASTVHAAHRSAALERAAYSARGEQ